MYKFNQSVDYQPNVLISSTSETSLTVKRKLIALYRNRFEPTGTYLIVGLDVNNPVASQAVDELALKGYPILYNLKPWDYPEETYKFVI